MLADAAMLVVGGDRGRVDIARGREGSHSDGGGGSSGGGGSGRRAARRLLGISHGRKEEEGRGRVSKASTIRIGLTGLVDE